MSTPEEMLSNSLPINDELLNTARIIDRVEGYRIPHARKMAELADLVARKFDLSAHDRNSLQQAVLLHDIGEMIMERDYFNVNRSLTAKERLDMQRHPVIGEQETAKRGLGRAVQLIVRWHHEWWNGAGYPDGLEKESIPLAARILRVVDTYSALTETRSYNAQLLKSEANRYLAEWAGIEFDPKVVQAFMDITEPKSRDQLKLETRF